MRRRTRGRGRLRLLLLAALACGSPASTVTGPGGPGSGGLVPIATTFGAPVAAPRAATVNAASGGALSSADGALAISVPAGAVADAAELTLMPITATARGAVGPAFRLGPEGTTFSAPVTLTFKAPDRYATGTSIAGLGVEYQDARGFWHRVEPVVRDASARTVTVSTTHFSDWALTWQLGTAAAEGPITLVQTVGIPFAASGRATLFFQSDDASDTSYAMTGTLTVPDTFKVGDSQCVPDETTKTLPLGMAEVHKAQPPVFRWGIGATWTLTCTAPGGAVTTELLPAQFDTLSINLTRCGGGTYLPGQVVDADRLAGAYTTDCGVEGIVSATWDLRACVAGQPCPIAVDCRLGLTACDGTPSCVDTGPAPDGTACGPGEVGTCSDGGCIVR